MYEQYTLSKTKITLCALALSAILIGYNHFTNQASAQNDAATSPESESLTIVNKIMSLKLDTSLLEDDVFNSLVDFSQSIDAEPVGRPNPFVPSNAPAPRTEGR